MTRRRLGNPVLLSDLVALAVDAPTLIGHFVALHRLKCTGLRALRSIAFEVGRLLGVFQLLARR